MSKARTIRNGKLGKKVLELAEKGGRFFGLVDRKIIVEGENADDVWRQLHDDAGKSDPKYFGFDGARKRFLTFFPNGFHSDGYASQERDYKLAAKAKLDDTAPLEKAADGTGFGEAVLAVFRATNMLSPFEKTRLQDVLRGPHADDFVQAAARFTLDGSKSHLLAMEQALKPHDNAKWTVATYLPYLWRPDTHMFLKPEATKDFATRVGHRFASEYEARLNLAVYENLLDLVSKTERELADMRPRDRIDIQSFIWVVGDYQEGREAVYE
ncbi:hypothetical protein E0H71_00320 [Rhizobium leguminosarum bv. viciae]|uniref:hypothetical protein n=1 Tax=Rhizobium leguminosarum TaxID=384 RepID=UPI00103BFC02|nr:hypothetical protein [Rhizobium leguminosarum]TCA58081.1 hypothetical protein E0H71_00320 [Rhizobium leguminosarum bv. viciae]